MKPYPSTTLRTVLALAVLGSIQDILEHIAVLREPGVAGDFKNISLSPGVRDNDSSQEIPRIRRNVARKRHWYALMYSTLNWAFSPSGFARSSTKGNLPVSMEHLVTLVHVH
jgi:hypothetical protein